MFQNFPRVLNATITTAYRLNYPALRSNTLKSQHEVCGTIKYPFKNLLSVIKIINLRINYT